MVAAPAGHSAHKTRPESVQSSCFYCPEEHRFDGRASVLCAGSHWSALIMLARAVQPCARQKPQHNLANPARITKCIRLINPCFHLAGRGRRNNMFSHVLNQS